LICLGPIDFIQKTPSEIKIKPVLNKNSNIPHHHSTHVSHLSGTIILKYLFDLSRIENFMKFKAYDNKMEKNMIEQIEISTLDLRYESFRLKSRKAEKELCSLIVDFGIKEPLQGITTDDGCKILLNGFKRYRCAKKLKINIVPYVSFGSDEPSGLIKLIRKSNSKKLNILEQAKLIDELKNIHKMTNTDIA